jgi:hypothetical protein
MNLELTIELPMKTLKTFWMIVFAMATCVVAVAQDDDPDPQQIDPNVRAKMEAARIALITNRLGLTPEQAEKFWPVYREFAQKRQEIRREFRQAQKNVDPNDQDPKKQESLVTLGLQLKQKELNLEKDYSGRIMNVITAQQLLNLRRAEQDFRQYIINELGRRRALQQRKENFRDKNQRLRLNRK